MRRHLPFALVGFVCLALIACQTGAGGLSEQDQAAIRKLDDDYSKTATSEKPDWNATVDMCYTEDAKALWANMAPLEGRQAIKAALAAFPPIKELTFTTVSLEGRGDLAYEYGMYSMTVAPPGSSPATDKGEYVTVLKKQADGAWKIMRDITHSELPAPGLTVTAGTPKSDAGPELKRLDWLVGQWKLEGDAKAGPLGPAGKYVTTLNCQWFPGGGQVVCGTEGTAPTGPFKELTIYSYDADAKAYTVFDMDNAGFFAAGRGSFQGGNWMFMFDTRAGGSPSRCACRSLTHQRWLSHGNWSFRWPAARGCRG